MTAEGLAPCLLPVQPSRRGLAQTPRSRTRWTPQLAVCQGAGEAEDWVPLGAIPQADPLQTGDSPGLGSPPRWKAHAPPLPRQSYQVPL